MTVARDRALGAARSAQRGRAAGAASARATSALPRAGLSTLPGAALRGATRAASSLASGPSVPALAAGTTLRSHGADGVAIATETDREGRDVRLRRARWAGVEHAGHARGILLARGRQRVALVMRAGQAFERELRHPSLSRAAQRAARDAAHTRRLTRAPGLSAGRARLAGRVELFVGDEREIAVHAAADGPRERDQRREPPESP